MFPFPRINSVLFLLLIMCSYGTKAFGQQELVCPMDPLPVGWVVTAKKLCTCCSASSSTGEQWTITDIYNEEPGATHLVCANQEIPEGWIISDMKKCSCCSTTGVGAQWKLIKVEGLPSGTILEVCAAQECPDGWVIKDIKSCTCCNELGEAGAQMTIKKL
ncbi:MAG: hypothetical protein R2792_20340 [Saprospiraceae bacterium]